MMYLSNIRRRALNTDINSSLILLLNSYQHQHPIQLLNPPNLSIRSEKLAGLIASHHG